MLGIGQLGEDAIILIGVVVVRCPFGFGYHILGLWPVQSLADPVYVYILQA